MVDSPRPVDVTSARANWVRHTLAPHVLERVSSALEAAGIPVLPVKGVVTAHLLYDDVSSRPIGDIDLRIPRRCFRRAVRVATAHAWSPHTEVPVLWTAMLKVDGWEVDIECTLGPPGLCALSVEDVLRRAHYAVEPYGFPHLQPELNDHALMLVLNAFKDGLRPRPWAIEDLRRIAMHPGFDADVIVTRARAGGIVSALWIVADWLVEAHAAAEWGAVRDRIGPRPPSKRVARSYGYVQGRGWPPKPGLLATAGASDDLLGSASGLALAAVGVLRGRCVRALRTVGTP